MIYLFLKTLFCSNTIGNFFLFFSWLCFFVLSELFFFPRTILQFHLKSPIYNRKSGEYFLNVFFFIFFKSLEFFLEVFLIKRLKKNIIFCLNRKKGKTFLNIKRRGLPHCFLCFKGLFVVFFFPFDFVFILKEKKFLILSFFIIFLYLKTFFCKLKTEKVNVFFLETLSGCLLQHTTFLTIFLLFSGNQKDTFVFDFDFGAFIFFRQLFFFFQFYTSLKKVISFFSSFEKNLNPIKKKHIERGDSLLFHNICVDVNKNRLWSELSLKHWIKENTLIYGESGSGKTILTKTIDLSYPLTKGEIILPFMENRKSVMCVSHQQTFIDGSIMDQLFFPEEIEDPISDLFGLGSFENIIDSSINGKESHFVFTNHDKMTKGYTENCKERANHVLNSVGVSNIITYFGGIYSKTNKENWDNLPMGVKERLIIARVLFHRPCIAILDSAFNSINETDMMKHLSVFSELNISVVVLTSRKIKYEKWFDKIVYLNKEKKVPYVTKNIQEKKTSYIKKNKNVSVEMLEI